MEPLAHSARPNRGVRAQSYADHVRGVVDLACANALEVTKYWSGGANKLVEAVRVAAEFHDLGKLEQANQAVLNQDFRGGALPVNHVDAGVAHLLDPSTRDPLAASLVYAHHVGLPDFPDQEVNPPGTILRDVKANELLGQTTKYITDLGLGEYLRAHKAAVGSLLDQQPTGPPSVVSPVPPVFFRIALSCLVDADHSDTSMHQRQVVSRSAPPLRPNFRLTLLDDYVSGLAKEQKDDRNLLRGEVYRTCRRANPCPGFYACDSPVGTGKTTAVMAHLLNAAKTNGLRRIFVVLPFTNIIDQSVEVYRKALVGPGEHREDVVAAQHHRAEFEDPEARHLSFLWKAPMVVTTAVQFFETLASNRPTSVRKLHQLPGSAIFIDEAHAALPAHLWPQAWKWLRELECDWGCHFVLGSGSLNRFWELEEFSEPPLHIPELISPDLKAKVKRYEKRRVTYRSRADLLTMQELLAWLPEIPGPRLLIVNTVQSAAGLARSILERSGRRAVEHLSTALCPRDRKVTLDRVKRRLEDRRDEDWNLVATSCVEAGLNLSFRNGLRERCSLNSLIQVGGRVSREGEYADSTVWDFQLQHDAFLKPHPAFEAASRILGELFDEGEVAAEASSEAMRREVRQEGLRDISRVILKAERNLRFPIVAEKFSVIDSNTVTVVVDHELIRCLEKREWVDPDLFQDLSVQVWRYREVDYALERVAGFRDLYCWKLEYDDFLGYMKGVLQKIEHEQSGTVV